MFKKKEKLDERQLLEIYKIEHTCFWIMFYILFAGVVIESYLMPADPKQIAVEWITLLVGAAGILIGCVKKGQWGCSFHPSVKNYFLISFFSAIAAGIILAIGKYMQYDTVREKPWMLLAIGGIFAFFTFVLIFVAFLLTGHLIQKRASKLESEYEEDDDIKS